MTITIDAEALSGLITFVESIPGISNTAASRAINQVATRTGMKRIQDSIYGQIAFPKGYLNLPDRLGVTKYSKAEDLEAIIRARQRATSMARFLTPGQTINTSRVSGVKVMIRPGVTQTLKNAFLMRLNAGSVNTETQNNLGLAIRVKAGEPLSAGKGIRLESASNKKTDLYLLYTASVDQVFRHVAAEESDAIASDVEAEYRRQFILLTGG